MPEQSPIRAIVFDCFGVLTTDGWIPFKRKYFAHNSQLAQQATDLRRMVDRGMYDHEQFVQDIARMAGVPTTEAQQYATGNVPNEELFAYIQTELKPHYKIGMLSNIGGNWLGRLLRPEQLAVFDAITLSYELGVTKPETRAYEAIAHQLAVATNECVMVDDQERHCTGARDAGMLAVQYKDVPQIKRDLNKLLT